MASPIVVVRFSPKAGTHETVEQILRTMVDATRAEQGCRRYDLFRAQDASAGPLFFLIEHYVDDAAVQAHRETAHYKSYRSSILPLLEQPPEVQLLESIDSKPY
jgi:quinol monooxygenase YgiN